MSKKPLLHSVNLSVGWVVSFYIARWLSKSVLGPFPETLGEHTRAEEWKRLGQDIVKELTSIQGRSSSTASTPKMTPNMTIWNQARELNLALLQEFLESYRLWHQFQMDDEEPLTKQLSGEESESRPFFGCEHNISYRSTIQELGEHFLECKEVTADKMTFFKPLMRQYQRHEAMVRHIHPAFPPEPHIAICPNFPPEQLQVLLKVAELAQRPVQFIPVLNQPTTNSELNSVKLTIKVDGKEVDEDSGNNGIAKAAGSSSKSVGKMDSRSSNTPKSSDPIEPMDWDRMKHEWGGLSPKEAFGVWIFFWIFGGILLAGSQVARQFHTKRRLAEENTVQAATVVALAAAAVAVEDAKGQGESYRFTA